MDNNILSIYLLAPFAAWLVAQSAKVVFSAVKNTNKKDYSLFVKSGGMPSAHAAMVLALLTVVGARNGTGSALFGVVFIVGAIVIYDAVNVRRAVGEQGEFLKKVSKNIGQEPSFYTANGHRPTEVAVGAVLGCIIAFAMLQIL